MQFLCTTREIKFPFKETADLVTFTDKIFNGKLHFSCSDVCLHKRGVFKISDMYIGCILLRKHITVVSH